jgi:hypothetical protein
MQGGPGGKVSILRGYVLLRTVSETAMDVIAHIKERQDALKRTTCHVLTRVAKCIVDRITSCGTMTVKRRLFLVDIERVNNVQARSNITFDATELQNRDVTINVALISC